VLLVLLSVVEATRLKLFSDSARHHTSSVPHGAVKCSTIQYITVQYSTVQYNTIQYSEVQCSAVFVDYSTLQYTTLQLIAVLVCCHLESRAHDGVKGRSDHGLSVEDSAERLRNHKN
jgi:hypothetical protein